MTRLAFPALLLITLLPACRTLDGGSGERWVRTELYFGLTQPGGTRITDSEWRSFLDSAITSRFPDGLTVLDGYGQYRNNAGAVTREPMRLLVLLHHATDAERRSIAEIRALYRAAFNQESVLEVASGAEVSF